jgi:alpha-galactosidase
VGIDQEEDGKGNGYVDFQVLGDGVVLYDSGVLTNDQVGHIDINVTGVQNLELIATNGIANNIDYDHADWAGAELLS